MKQGTKSMLFGIHQFIIHPLFVTLAWKKRYKRWPYMWELICIVLHDIGHWQTDYLINYTEKQRHWIKGAETAYLLFGLKGFRLVAGHYPEYSGVRESMLAWPDRYAHVIAPLLWTRWTRFVEDLGIDQTPAQWREMVANNLNSSSPKGNHELFMDLKNGR
ncbi:MAG: hypothetical protein DRJ03_00965 [Chloroflexi bacterium]|nr:MAG: hypothetical protein DRJ03_00965 [Chloroflexota bacterium]